MRPLNNYADRVVRFFYSPVRTFALIASIFGLLTIVLMPPFTGADEEAHFVRAYGITEGSVTIGEDQLVEMPKSYLQTLGCMQNKQPSTGNTYTYNYEAYGKQKVTTLKCALNLKLEEDNTEMVVTTASGYSPTTYIPQLLIIEIGKWLNLPVVTLAYGARLSVLAAYVIMISYAIKLLPRRKWALVGIALMPTSILQVSNPGGDYMLLGAVAIFLSAIILSIYEPKQYLMKNNRRLLSIITLSSLMMVLPKGIFPGICFLPLILFYGGIKYELHKKSGILFSVLLAGLLWQKFGVTVIIGNSNNHTISPLDFPYALFKTSFYGMWSNKDFIFNSLNLGLNNPLGMPALAISAMNMLFAMHVFVGYSVNKNNLHSTPNISEFTLKLLNLSTWVVSSSVIIGSFFALFFAASYLQDASGLIRGVQARYFYPAFILLAIMPLARFFYAKKSTFRLVTICGSALLLIIQTVALIIRYQWIH